MNFKRLGALLSISIITSTSIGTQIAKAGFLQDAAKRFEKSVRTETGRATKSVKRSRIYSRVKICNNSKFSRVRYKVGGSHSALRNGYCETWKIPGRAQLSFHQGGSLGIRSYSLGDGKYNFLDVTDASAGGSRSAIDLFR